MGVGTICYQPARYILLNYYGFALLETEMAEFFEFGVLCDAYPRPAASNEPLGLTDRTAKTESTRVYTVKEVW